MEQIRQGDILLVAVKIAPPKHLQPQASVTLADGETTGHAHRLLGASVYTWEADGQRYVQVAGPDPGALLHEDHDPTPAAVVSPGVTYRVIRQSEWDLKGQWRKVQD